MEPINGGRRHKAVPVSDLLSTHEPSFKQGHVGDLHLKSKVELQELLERQEKLLANRNFILKLPDKGAKLSQFAGALRQRIDEINKESRQNNDDSIEMTNVEDDFQSVENDEGLNRMNQVEENMEEQALSVENKLTVIEKGFTNLAIHEGPHYDVIKKAGEKPRKSKFSLNRQQERQQERQQDKKDNDLYSSVSMDTSAKYSPKTEHGDNSSMISLTSAPRELSSAAISDPKKSAVLISTEECRELHIKQQEIIKEQQAQLAAQRMMAKYGIGEAFLSPEVDSHPEGVIGHQDEHPEDDEEIHHIGPTLDGFND